MTATADTLVERLDDLADVHSDNHPTTAGMVREAAARIRELEAKPYPIGFITVNLCPQCGLEAQPPFNRCNHIWHDLLKALRKAALKESK